MKKYIGIARNEFMSSLTYREHFVTSFVTELLFFIVLYFLWSAIYAGNGEKIAGMTMEQTYVSVSLAVCLMRCLTGGIDWEMHFQMIQGDIVVRMVKPVDYMYQMLWMKIGGMMTNLITYLIPVFVVVIILFPKVIYFGANIPVFILCMCISFLVMFTFEFIIGIFTFYTESVWGLSTMKDLIVSFFAGVEVPVAFFPGWLKQVANVLPFKSLYNDPLQILMDGSLGWQYYLKVLGFQMGWLLVFGLLARVMYAVMQKKIIVNGG
ncbi:MAG: ABC transporter permease [Coprococcus sp.]